MGQTGLRGVVLNAPFVGSALSALGCHEVPLYVVSVLGPAVAVPNARGTEGAYCIVSVRRQHRVAASLFQCDYLTCAVKDWQWPHRVSVPVYVQGCRSSEMHALTVGVVRLYAAARMQAARQDLAALLSSYYHYAVKCNILALYHSCFLKRGGCSGAQTLKRIHSCG